MAEHETLLSSLAFKLVSQRENLAIEALAHVLRASATARRAMVEAVTAAGLELPGELTFDTQVSSDGLGRPDLIGYDDERRGVLIVEAKFWAGLTEHQPVSYLQQLPAGRPSGLLFIAPETRVAVLWPELLHRAKAGGLSVIARDEAAGVRAAHVNDQHWMAAISWRRLLSRIAQRLEAEGEDAVVADVRQLQGLCDRMDEDEFLPLRSEDLGQEIPRLILQLQRLANDIVDRVVEERLGDAERGGGTTTSDYVGRYLSVNGGRVWIGFWLTPWAEGRSTPIYLDVMNTEAANSLDFRSLFTDYEGDDTHARVFVRDDRLVFPIELPHGVDRDVVLRTAVDQVREIVIRLGHGPQTEA